MNVITIMFIQLWNMLINFIIPFYAQFIYIIENNINDSNINP